MIIYVGYTVGYMLYLYYQNMKVAFKGVIVCTCFSQVDMVPWDLNEMSVKYFGQNTTKIKQNSTLHSPV